MCEWLATCKNNFNYLVLHAEGAQISCLALYSLYIYEREILFLLSDWCITYYLVLKSGVSIFNITCHPEGMHISSDSQEACVFDWLVNVVGLRFCNDTVFCLLVYTPHHLEISHYTQHFKNINRKLFSLHNSASLVSKSCLHLWKLKKKSF